MLPLLRRLTGHMLDLFAKLHRQLGGAASVRGHRQPSAGRNPRRRCKNMNTTACPCGPVVEWEHAEPLVIHRSWDGREFVEDAERIINRKEAND